MYRPHSSDKTSYIRSARRISGATHRANPPVPPDTRRLIRELTLAADAMDAAQSYDIAAADIARLVGRPVSVHDAHAAAARIAERRDSWLTPIDDTCPRSSASILRGNIELILSRYGVRS